MSRVGQGVERRRRLDRFLGNKGDTDLLCMPNSRNLIFDEIFG